MNWSAAVVLLVPPAVVTVTWIAPAEPAGEVAVICVFELTVKAAAVAPKLTALTFELVAPPKNPLPVIVTLVPPEVGPEVGEMPVTAGAAK